MSLSDSMGRGSLKQQYAHDGEGGGREWRYRIGCSSTAADEVGTVHGVFLVSVWWDSVSTMMHMHTWHTNTLFSRVDFYIAHRFDLRFP